MGMNTFGEANEQFALCDHTSVIEDRARFRRDAVPLLRRTNSFYCQTGRWPFRGWVLLPRSEYDKVDRHSTTLQLNIGDTTDANNVSTLKNLAIVQARCVTRGLASDRDALYLIELTDGRGLVHNEWFQHPLVKAYNIRSPGYPQTFQLDSMKDYPAGNGKTTWTWTTMLQNIWEEMGTHLGDWPGLPFAPAGTPEGFWFPGVPAWTALCDVLDHIGMTIACDLTQADNPFTIVEHDAADAAHLVREARFAPNLEDDMEWIDEGAGRVPRFVKVLFRRRNSVYGTEETVAYRNDVMAFQWDMAAVHTILIDAPAEFEDAVGTHYIWSDFTVRYDDSSNPLAADVAMATTIARERVRQYFARISGAVEKVYAGALPFVTGSQVSGVAWVQDYSNQSRQGWKTYIAKRDPGPVWPHIYGRDR